MNSFVIFRITYICRAYTSSHAKDANVYSGYPDSLIIHNTGCNKFKDPATRYRYSAPADAANELPVSSLAAEGMDEALITEATDLIIREKYKRVDGMLILRNNKLVYENYFHGYSSEIPHNIYSAGKSITGILIGIAIDKGFIADINSPVNTGCNTFC